MLKRMKRQSERLANENKRKGRKRLGDKGAALISVLIAVTFIAIIATSLLYMVYMNYLTKVMRHGSTDNFYTAEFALDDLSSEVQQIAVDEGLAGKNISDAIKKIRSEVGASSGSSTYDNDKVANLIKVATNDADIQITTSYPTGTNNYEDNGTSYVKLKGVVITATDEKGYVSTITSDIIIKFSADGGGELDICDFSVLSDNPVYVGQGDFIMTGCGYMQKNADGHEINSVPAGDCLLIGNGACVQMLSERAILNGDVEMKGNSVLTICGKVFVFGDIEMSANSQLVVTGELKVTGTVKKNGGKVIKKDTDSIEEHWTYPGGDKCPLYGGSTKKGLVNQLFCSKVGIWNSYSGGSFDYFDFNNYFLSSENGRKDYTTNSYKSSDTKLQMCAPDVFNSNFQNALALVPNKKAYVNGICTNSTIVSTLGYQFNGMSPSTPSYMQRMDKERYNWLINSCWPGSPRQDGGQLVDSDGHSIGGTEVKGPGFGTQMPNDSSGYTKKTYTYDGEPRTVYYDPSSGTFYMPIKYLLDDDTAGIITDLFDSLSNNSDPTKSTVVYDNWEKE